MEVTKISDKVTHAVISRGSVESFGLSEDAELYSILSNALYSRKKEAAVREVLCNAWDSHVDSEITDVPVEITLTKDKLTVRDFGQGLAPDRIKPVYGTYGKSTKQHDGRQTGGFGLGSKAPFAYTDHFQVISCHDNLKTIYKMSQSNAEVGGKPSITTIVSVPTDESGLEVSFDLKNSEDRHEFETLITRIVEMGDMNVTLNGSHLETIPFSESEHGFMLIKAERFGRTSYHTISDYIMVRYGHVVYPLKSDDRFAHLFNNTVDFLKSLTHKDQYGGNASSQWVLVLQADPHTISVTPSREDLSMTDHTVETVTGLLRRFMHFARGKLEGTVEEMFTDAVNLSGLLSVPKTLFSQKKEVPLIDRLPQIRGNYVYDFDDLARRYMQAKYPSFDGFRAKDLRIRVDALIKTGYGNRGLLQSFKAELLNGAYQNSESTTSWFHRRLINLALRGGKIDADRLYVYTSIYKGRNRSFKEEGFVQATKWVAPSVEKCLPFLRGLVILTCSRAMSTIERASWFPVCKHWVGDPIDSLCYAVQRKPEKIDEAREHFTRLGFIILDLTKAQPWEHEDVLKPVERAPRQPKKKGVPRLDAALSTDTTFNTDRLWNDDAQRIIKPEFVVKVSSQKTNNGTFGDLRTSVCLAIARLYGKKGGVVQNSLQADKYKAEGAVELRLWLIEKILEEYKTNPRIAEHYKFSVSHLSDDGGLDWERVRVFKLARKDSVLRAQFSLPDPLTQQERDVIEIFESWERYDRRRPEFAAQLKEIDDLILSWKLSPKAKVLVDKLKTSKLIGLLDTSDVESFILNEHNRYTPKQSKAARDILLLTLEG